MTVFSLAQGILPSTTPETKDGGGWFVPPAKIATLCTNDTPKNFEVDQHRHHLAPQVLEAVLEVDVTNGNDTAPGAMRVILSRSPVKPGLLEPLEVRRAVYLPLLVEPREIHEDVALMHLPRFVRST